MKRKFNVLGNCVPDRHYMVDISGKLAQIQVMVDEGAILHNQPCPAIHGLDDWRCAGSR